MPCFLMRPREAPIFTDHACMATAKNKNLPRWPAIFWPQPWFLGIYLILTFRKILIQLCLSWIIREFFSGVHSWCMGVKLSPIIHTKYQTMIAVNQFFFVLRICVGPDPTILTFVIHGYTGHYLFQGFLLMSPCLALNITQLVRPANSLLEWSKDLARADPVVLIYC